MTYLTRKPDHVVYKMGFPSEPFYITVFGDNKECAIGMQGFSDEDKGHLLDFATDLFKVQKFRSFVYAFLTNGIVVQWFRFTLKEDGIVHSSEFPAINYKTAGLASICNMLASDPSGLGWSLPVVNFQGHSVELQKVLGHGGFSVVYQGKLQDEMVVVKHFHKLVTEPLLPHITQHRDTEIVMLQKVAAKGISGVTKFKGLSADNRAILLSPIGVHFARLISVDIFVLERLTCLFRSSNEIMQVMTTSDSSYRFCTAKNLCGVVDILENLHKIKIVHRDVRVANFFWNPHTEVLCYGHVIRKCHRTVCLQHFL